MISDEELCRQIQEKNGAALEILIQRYYRPIFAYLYRLLESHPGAEDLTQETFTRLISYFDSYHYPQAFRPWLYSIAHNLYKDYCKMHHTRLSTPMAQPTNPNSAEPIDLSERLAQRAEVMAALRELDPAHREVVVLRFYQDLKVEEIAAVVGVPAGTVRSRLFASAEKLRESLQRADSVGRRSVHEAARRRDR